MMLFARNRGWCSWVWVAAAANLLISMSALADTTDFKRNLDVVVKSLSDDKHDHNYYGLSYRLSQFGFVTLSGVFYGTPDNVEQELPAALGNTQDAALQNYWGINVALLFAISDVTLEMGYLWGQGLGFYHESSGDTLGTCHCSMGLTEFSLAASLAIARHWDLGVTKTQMKVDAGGGLQLDLDGQGVFIRYSW